MTFETVLYSAKTNTTGGRENGAVRTDDSRPDIKVLACNYVVDSDFRR